MAGQQINVGAGRIGNINQSAKATNDAWLMAKRGIPATLEGSAFWAY